MAQVPSDSQIVTVPAATDWMAISKTIVIELAFVGTIAEILFGHNYNQEVLALAWGLGGTLGVLRITDVVASVVNVKSFLSKPGSGVVPQASGTGLITSASAINGSAGAMNSAPPVQ